MSPIRKGEAGENKRKASTLASQCFDDRGPLPGLEHRNNDTHAFKESRTPTPRHHNIPHGRREQPTYIAGSFSLMSAETVDLVESVESSFVTSKEESTDTPSSPAQGAKEDGEGGKDVSKLAARSDSLSSNTSHRMSKIVVSESAPSILPSVDADDTDRGADGGTSKRSTSSSTNLSTSKVDDNVIQEVGGGGQVIEEQERPDRETERASRSQIAKCVATRAIEAKTEYTCTRTEHERDPSPSPLKKRKRSFKDTMDVQGLPLEKRLRYEPDGKIDKTKQREVISGLDTSIQVVGSLTTSKTDNSICVFYRDSVTAETSDFVQEPTRNREGVSDHAESARLTNDSTSSPPVSGATTIDHTFMTPTFRPMRSDTTELFDENSTVFLSESTSHQQLRAVVHGLRQTDRQCGQSDSQSSSAKEAVDTSPAPRHVSAPHSSNHGFMVSETVGTDRLSKQEQMSKESEAGRIESPIQFSRKDTSNDRCSPSQEVVAFCYSSAVIPGTSAASSSSSLSACADRPLPAPAKARGNRDKGFNIKSTGQSQNVNSQERSLSKNIGYAPKFFGPHFPGDTGADGVYHIFEHPQADKTTKKTFDFEAISPNFSRKGTSSIALEFQRSNNENGHARPNSLKATSPSLSRSTANTNISKTAGKPVFILRCVWLLLSMVSRLFFGESVYQVNAFGSRRLFLRSYQGTACVFLTSISIVLRFSDPTVGLYTLILLPLFLTWLEVKTPHSVDESRVAFLLSLGTAALAHWESR
jgi:hypothetical protein